MLEGGGLDHNSNTRWVETVLCSKKGWIQWTHLMRWKHAELLVGYDLLMFLGPAYHAGLHHYIVGAHLGRQ
jgi:hypothetical protein